MSKKRSKNARKKAVKKKAAQGRTRPQPASAAPGGAPPPPPPVSEEAALAALRLEESDWARGDEEPDADIASSAVAVKEGGGAIGTFRTRLTPGAGRPGDTLLTKRRSLGELSLWLGGAVGLFWLGWKLVQWLNPPL